ncbi:flagellin [Sporosarcina sp. P21c]|uniref:flagellin N-terminal helical domain-containing protein n=1 Tax=Sporosarcina sp. P21c TaxID=2048255 RepID=UPI000C170686|nr:flagellin [Sporosarcina sp. P21c]PIC88557.1 flagellin [Sporosarcina sp. P21c]
MIINHNMAAMNTHRQLGSNNAAAANNIEKLSSGLKINRAGDDAAGLAISEKMRGQIRGLDMASKNSQDAISLVQTAEGSLNETHDILQRMRELAVQAGNDTNTGNDRDEIQKEINSLTSEVNRIGNTTEFNTQKLLDGSKDVNTAAKSGITAVAAEAGKYTVTLSGTSGSVVIDNVTITATGTGSKASGATAMATAVNADADLSKKYTATVSGDNLVLTQKSGMESATAPVVTGSGTTAVSVAGVSGVIGREATASGKSMNFQIGANQNQSMTLDIADMRASALGISSATGGSGFTTGAGVTDGTNNTSSERALDVSSHESAAKAVTVIQDAIDKVSAERSKLGANQNRLEHTINNLGTSSENLTAAESRIRDVDYVLAA